MGRQRWNTLWGDDTVSMAASRAFGLEQEDRAGEVGEAGADVRGERHEVAAHDEAGRVVRRAD